MMDLKDLVSYIIAWLVKKIPLTLATYFHDKPILVGCDGRHSSPIISKVAVRAANEALQVHGGYGFIKDYPVEKFYRDAKIGKIYEGTSNMQLATIAKAMQG